MLFKFSVQIDRLLISTFYLLFQRIYLLSILFFLLLEFVDFLSILLFRLIHMRLLLVLFNLEILKFGFQFIKRLIGKLHIHLFDSLQKRICIDRRNQMLEVRNLDHTEQGTKGCQLIVKLGNLSLLVR